jgi:hypothetical protein
LHAHQNASGVVKNEGHRLVLWSSGITALLVTGATDARPVAAPTRSGAPLARNPSALGQLLALLFGVSKMASPRRGSAAILAASERACKMQALPTRIGSLPATWIQFFELRFGVGEKGVAGFEDYWRGAQEWLFRGDAIDPTLLGELFVVGKAETQE